MRRAWRAARAASSTSCARPSAKAEIIAAATLWASQGVQGAYERTWAITQEGDKWRVAVAMAEGTDASKYDYDDVDSLIQYIYEE